MKIQLAALVALYLATIADAAADDAQRRPMLRALKKNEEENGEKGGGKDKKDSGDEDDADKRGGSGDEALMNPVVEKVLEVVGKVTEEDDDKGEKGGKDEKEEKGGKNEEEKGGKQKDDGDKKNKGDKVEAEKDNEKEKGGDKEKDEGDKKEKGGGDKNAEEKGGKQNDGEADTAAAGVKVGPTIAQAVTQSTIGTALQVAGLTETFQGDGPFTVLAPTDAAFAALGDDVLTCLTTTDVGISVLTDILLYHVVSNEEKIFSTDFTTGAFGTLAGEEIAVEVDGTTITINETTEVVNPDNDFSNGVVHFINEVLDNPKAELDRIEDCLVAQREKGGM